MSSYAAMNAPRAEEDERAMSEINTTPLVDVMLVLLIVFMITIPVITHTVPLELPHVEQPRDARPSRRTSTSPSTGTARSSGTSRWLRTTTRCSSG